MTRMFLKILKKLFFLLGKKIVILDKGSDKLGRTAVRSTYNFWYVGNVFDISDIAYGIMRNGLVEKEETELVVKILTKLTQNNNVVFYDIGANTGYYGILAAHLNKEKIGTCSFEPIEKYAGCIRESARLNHLNNIQVFNTALGDQNTTQTIQLAGSGSSLNKEFNGNEKLPTRTITVKKLDDIVRDEKLTLPDFIKIDVEGYEYEVLMGGLNSLKQSLPVLFVEIAFTLKNLKRDFINKNFDKTFDLLLKMGYQAYGLENGSIKPSKTEEKPDGIHMYLFLHREKHQTLIASLV